MTTPTNWRALCAELLEALEIQLDELASTNRLCKRARAALAQPEPEGPTYEELRLMAIEWSHRTPVEFARAVLARWGRLSFERPRPEPQERKPAPDYDRVPEIATKAQIRAAAQYLIKKKHCDGDLIPAIEYAIARWGRPAIKPVPVRERPWEREGWCDAEGRCWWGRIEGNPANPEWFLAGLPEIEEFYEIGDWVVLLPHHALPVPQSQA